MGLLIWRQSRSRGPSLPVRDRMLGPTRRSRSVASAAVSPVGPDCSLVNASCSGKACHDGPSGLGALLFDVPVNPDCFRT